MDTVKYEKITDDARKSDFYFRAREMIVAGKNGWADAELGFVAAMMADVEGYGHIACEILTETDTWNEYLDRIEVVLEIKEDRHADEMMELEDLLGDLDDSAEECDCPACQIERGDLDVEDCEMMDEDEDAGEEWKR